MKKYPLLLLITLFLTAGIKATAQTCAGQHQIEISYGLVSGREIADGLTQDEDGNGIIEGTAGPNLFLTYRYFVKRRLAVGLTIGHQQINNSAVDDYGGIQVSNFNISNTTFAGEVMFEYLNRKWIQLYTMGGIGVSYYDYQGYSNTTGQSVPYINGTAGERFNCQLDPIAIRCGGRLSYFLEIGMGYKGLVNSGLSFRLGKQTEPESRKRRRYY